MKRKPGRPSLLTKARHKAIVNAFRAGGDSTTVSRTVGLKWNTISGWLARGADEVGKEAQRYSELLHDVDAAQAACEQEALNCLREAATGYTEETVTVTVGPDGTETKTSTTTRKDWRAAVAYLDRRYADRYGPRSTIEHTGEVGVKHLILDGTDPFEDDEEER